jgi:L-tryptophan--pyruvate aminotransferase
MATIQRRLIASQEEFQGNGGGLMPRVLASPGGREEHAKGKPRGSVLSAAKGTVRRRTARGTPLWRVAVFASVALNVATLALLLYHYAVSHPAASPEDQRHDACAPQPDTSGAPAPRTGEPTGRDTRAPSTGKPAVTHDSVINLDQ